MKEFGLEMSLLVIFGIAGLLVNILTGDGKYSVRNRENLWQKVQIEFSKKQNFSQFLDAKKISLITDVFPKLETAKNVVG